MAGNHYKGKKRWLKAVVLQHSEFFNRLATCSRKKEILVTLEDASCVRK
jgi:hypothetical protein